MKTHPGIVRWMGVPVAALLVAACSSETGGARIAPGANNAWASGAVAARTRGGAVAGGACANPDLLLCSSGSECCPPGADCCGDGSCADDCDAPTLPNGCPEYAPYPCALDECCSSQGVAGSGGGSGSLGWCGCADPSDCCSDGTCGCGSALPACSCVDPTTCCGDGSCNCGAPTCFSCADGTNCCADGSCGC